MRECCGGPLAVQVDMSVTRKYGGTGLGLSIVRQLVQAHEGEIHCRSKEGRGTAFTMKMPVMQSGRAIRHSLEAKVCVCVCLCVCLCVCRSAQCWECLIGGRLILGALHAFIPLLQCLLGRPASWVRPNLPASCNVSQRALRIAFCLSLTAKKISRSAQCRCPCIPCMKQQIT